MLLVIIRQYKDRPVDARTPDHYHWGAFVATTRRMERLLLGSTIVVNAYYIFSAVLAHALKWKRLLEDQAYF